MSDVTASAAVDELSAALHALVGRSLASADIPTLQPLVCAVVDEMISDGVLPERILIAMRQIVQDAGLDWQDDRIGEPVIRWCLRRYFRPGETGE